MLISLSASSTTVIDDSSDYMVMRMGLKVVIVTIAALGLFFLGVS